MNGDDTPVPPNEPLPLCEDCAGTGIQAGTDLACFLCGGTGIQPDDVEQEGEDQLTFDKPESET
jgi:hypothetical protein